METDEQIKEDVLTRLNAIGTMIDDLHDGVEAAGPGEFKAPIAYIQETLGWIEAKAAGMRVVTDCLAAIEATKPAATPLDELRTQVAERCEQSRRLYESGHEHEYCRGRLDTYVAVLGLINDVATRNG